MGALAAVAGLLLCVLVIRLARRRQTSLLPPGPPADPLIGHIRVFPDVPDRADVFYEWSLKYGDIFSLRVPGKTIIVLNSEKVATELLEKRSVLYSDRARLPFFDIMGWGDGSIFAAYGPFHTLQRKLYNDAFSKNAVSQYWGILERESNVLIKGMMDEPAAYDRYVQRFAGGIVTDIGYGHRIDSFDDEIFTLGETWNHMAPEASAPSLLDLHPIFQHLPSWAPGAWFIQLMKDAKPFIDAIAIGNHEKVQAQMRDGTARPSYTSKHLEAMYRGDTSPEMHRAVRLSAAMIYAAGFDTTWHTVTVFLAAVLMHPEVQKRAQEEIDRVIGRDRLPDLTDRDSLPYVQCIMYETMRWQPVAPLGLPHQTTADDVYNGMHIPKGAIVIACARSMTWDETKFHEPRQFKPERFLPKPEGAGETFPERAVFGWGRRICAGRHLAEGSVWLAIARILATLTISKAKDGNGQTIEPHIKFVDGVTRHVEPFLCDIQPRDEVARSLIQDSSRD